MIPPPLPNIRRISHSVSLGPVVSLSRPLSPQQLTLRLRSIDRIFLDSLPLHNEIPSAPLPLHPPYSPHPHSPSFFSAWRHPGARLLHGPFQRGPFRQSECQGQYQILRPSRQLLRHVRTPSRGSGGREGTDLDFAGRGVVTGESMWIRSSFIIRWAVMLVERRPA